MDPYGCSFRADSVRKCHQSPHGEAAFAVDAAGNSLWCTSVSMSEESLAVGKQVNKYGDMKVPAAGTFR